MLRKCFLCCARNLHQPICLNHLEEVVVGRDVLTNITDLNCSRQQLSLTADCNKCLVSIKQLGRNPSGINGYQLERNKSISVEDKSQIEILLENHFHIVKFDPPAEITEERNGNKAAKRKESLNEEGEESREAKKSKKTTEKNLDSRNKKSPRKDSPEKLKGEMSPTLEVYRKLEEDPKLVAKEDNMEKFDDGKLYIFTSRGVVSRSKIAAYDMDGTLTKTKSGKVFPKDIYDWQIAFPEVPAKLKSYHASGYKVVIFTNQGSIGKNRLRIQDFQTKLQSIIDKIGVPIQAFISPGHHFYRKPSTGMWDTLVHMKNDDVEIDMSASFYCGDAAGRKKDHSFADRLFADNIGIRFMTPEPHFCGAKEAPFNRPSFEPKLLNKDVKNDNLVIDKQEILVLVGFPASGKSSISKQLEKSSSGRYRAVCRDVLGAWQKCVSHAGTLLQSGNSVIADSTNPDKESRSRWVELARKHQLPCRCVLLDVPMHHALHNNRYRQLTDTTHAHVADMVFYTYRKKFEEPSLAEGFTDIVKLKFIPQFDNEDQEKLYFKHLLEK